MIGRVLLAAILAGLAAGLIMGVIQHVRLTPLILQAETFEHGGAHDHGAAATAAPEAEAAEAWAPADGPERTYFTYLASALVAIGYAAVLAGISFLTGIPITRENGLVWGGCGFLAVSFAPAIGLPPELPGMPAADLTARQIWWAATIVLTGLGLYLLNRNRTPWIMLAGVAAILVTHIVGAPQPPTHESNVPPGLLAQFITASLGANLVMWCLIGFLLARTLAKFAEAEKS